MEEIITEGKLKLSIKSTFIALIPKLDHPSSFDDFKPIASCNCLYKMHSKIIAMRLMPLLSNYITQEQFGFVKERLIHEAIGATQEGIHTIKTHRKEVAVFKIDLSKSFDKVSWLFLHLLLLHIGFELQIIKWIMTCVTQCPLLF
jgi:hypothetical protein